MTRLVAMTVGLWALMGWAQGGEVMAVDDGGVTQDAPPQVDAGVPEPVVAAPAVVPAEPPGPFDLVQSPWGPGRKASGEKFSSAAVPLVSGPFRLAGEKWSLGLGGQYFARGELRDNRDFNGASGDHDLGVEHRARLSVRGSVLGRVGVVVEFQDVRFWGSEPNTTTTTANTGLHQGYVDVKATDWLDVRIGR